MAWRLAKSLETLRSQVNQAYPNRSKVSDGTIGDQRHQEEASDHNPNRHGVVCALDLTHDPANGFDAHKFADTLLANRHPEVKYTISNSRIAGSWTKWQWAQHHGEPHDKHIHISVGIGGDGESEPPYDSTQRWILGNVKGTHTMITSNALSILYRFRLGRGPDAQARKAIGARTFDEVDASILKSPEYKQRVKQVQNAQKVIDSQLPTELRIWK